ncbi:hypothetical protein SCHPADRAFT_920183 [Schizopora paradoxa]|uniref:Uncharacterized protein n=1 Tax=Schizopora paradoxa TaxID=27342 RepID=A0A0H2RUK5_9AGAM|nr:hypothetical protein SCHPADRAFT_920183 [Schizopora paradoxa]
MDFTNINDPAGISALLNTLRTSQAWADLQAAQQSANTAEVVEQQHTESQSTSAPHQAPLPNAEGTDSEAKPTETPSSLGGSNEGLKSSVVPSVAGLLSQLSGTSSQDLLHNPTPFSATNYGSSSSLPYGHLATVTSREGEASTIKSQPESSLHSQQPVIQKSLRTLSFQQALPVIANLSEDPGFVEAVLQLRKDQDSLEEQLWNEREDIIAAQNEKVKVAVTKANLVGGQISEREANTMRDAFVKQLDNFNNDRVFPAWDAMMHRQQSKLESLGVPTMYKTESGADRHRQQKIIQVLEGITSGQDPEDACMW